MTSEAYVWIYLPGAEEPVVCGRVDEPRKNQFSFRYGRSYLERANAIALAPEGMDRDGGPVYGRVEGSLPNAIRDGAPDHWGRRVIHYSRKINAAAEIDYLLLGSRDRIGALVFSPSATELPPVPPDVPVDIATLELAARGVDTSTPITDEMRAALEHGTTIGGARPKATFYNEQGEPWIIKFSAASDQGRNVLWEAAAMRLAREAGIRTADSRLARINGRDALLVRRFDREPGDNGGWRRRHMLSALTLLDLDEREARESSSYLDLAENVLLRYAEDPSRDCPELFRRMVFNILIGNTDDHARNHACFWDGRWLHLTPAYDLSPSSRVGQEADQAMQVGRRGRSSTLANALSESRRFGLTPVGAAAVVDELVWVVQDRWKQVFLEEGVPEMEVAAFEGRAILSPVALLREFP